MASRWQISRWSVVIAASAAACSQAATGAAPSDAAAEVASTTDVAPPSDAVADVAAKPDTQSPDIHDVTAPSDGAADAAADVAADAGADLATADAGKPDSAAADVGVVQVQCAGPDVHFPLFSKVCKDDAGCVVALHQINCCGSMIAIGIGKGASPAFLDAESQCQQQYPACGCASMPTQAEDGYAAMGGETDIAVHCVAQVCTTSIKAAKLDCKDPVGGVPKPFKFCEKQSDCTYVLHTSDCCGTQVALGITKAAKDAYEKAEVTCSAQMPVCDCLPKATTAEDGASAGDGMLAVACNGSMCLSYVKQ